MTLVIETGGDVGSDPIGTDPVPLGSDPNAPDVGDPTPFARVDRLLDELESLILTVPVTVFEAVPDDGSASIAQHVGRALDVIETLVVRNSGSGNHPPDHDVVEIDAVSCLRKLRALEAALVHSRSVPVDRVVRVEGPAWPDSGDRSWSTLEVEIAFAVNHIVDAQKIIERRMQSYGYRVPKGFGSMELQPLRARSTVPPSWALWRLLDELELLASGVSIEVYREHLASNVSGSIGEHVRHCLDHVAALLSADPADTLSYDHRDRGTAVETDPGEALRAILQLKRGLHGWSMRALDEPVRVASMISPNGDTVTGWSTLGRELAFVVSHTIHHQALIGVLLAIQGQTVPDRFGHSPSTPQRH